MRSFRPSGHGGPFTCPVYQKRPGRLVFATSRQGIPPRSRSQGILSQTACLDDGLSPPSLLLGKLKNRKMAEEVQIVIIRNVITDAITDGIDISQCLCQSGAFRISLTVRIIRTTGTQPVSTGVGKNYTRKHPLFSEHWQRVHPIGPAIRVNQSEQSEQSIR